MSPEGTRKTTMVGNIGCTIQSNCERLRFCIRNEVGIWLRTHRQLKGYSLEMASQAMEATLSPEEIYGIESGETCLFLKHFERFIQIYEIRPRDYVEFLSFLRSLIK